jgi:hypothetical protein
MFVIDVTLKHSPVTLSVQRKAEEDAKALYQQIVEALRTNNPALLELSCEQVVGKTVSVLVSEIAAVQVADKAGAATASGRSPGFFAMQGS